MMFAFYEHSDIFPKEHEIAPFIDTSQEETEKIPLYTANEEGK